MSLAHPWFRMPVEQTKACDLKPPKINSMRQVTPLTSDEWQQLGERLRVAAVSHGHDSYLPAANPLPCNETHRLKIGDVELRQSVGSSSIAFTFLARDAAAYVERNVMAIMNLGDSFARYWIFFVENDSADGTVEILRRLSSRHPQLRGEFLKNVSTKYSVRLCPDHTEKRNCVQRIQLLASLRQRVYEAAMAQPGWDALTMLDLDFLGFRAEIYLQTFALGLRLSASAIFGQSMVFDKQRHCMVYDSNAIVPKYAVRSVAGGCFGAVASAHSGFATLFAGPLRSATPRINYTDDVRGHNDLLPFNERLNRWGRSLGRPMLVDPRFRPTYVWGE